MINILVSIPYKETMPDVLKDIMRTLADNLIDANPKFSIEFGYFGKDLHTPMFPYAGPQAAARNALLDEYLKPHHEYVMWIDSDLIEYPPTIISRLYNANPGGVTAPCILIEDTQYFYDTYGFVQNGHKVSRHYPYFESEASLVELDGVGCAYLIPAQIYHDGNRYHTTPQHTEHMSIMQVAKKRGLKIACLADLIVYHADLPKYGLEWHGH